MAEVYPLTDEEIGVLEKAIPLLLEIKTRNIEDAVKDCGDVSSNYNRFKKMKKTLKRVHNDYKDTLKGLDYLAVNSDKYTRRVNAALKKYKDTKLYFEIMNGDSFE